MSLYSLLLLVQVLLAMTWVGGGLMWRAQRGRLHFWVVDHVWEPGPIDAACLKDERTSTWRSSSPSEPCEQSPGENYQCGIWSVWDLGCCLAKAREQGISAGVMP
jgi:hypothetical protein